MWGGAGNRIQDTQVWQGEVLPIMVEAPIVSPCFLLVSSCILNQNYLNIRILKWKEMPNFPQEVGFTFVLSMAASTFQFWCLLTLWDIEFSLYIMKDWVVIKIYNDDPSLLDLDSLF